MMKIIYLTSSGILEIFALQWMLFFEKNVLFISYLYGYLYGEALETSRFDKGCNTKKNGSCPRWSHWTNLMHAWWPGDLRMIHADAHSGWAVGQAVVQGWEPYGAESLMGWEPYLNSAPILKRQVGDDEVGAPGRQTGLQLPWGYRWTLGLGVREASMRVQMNPGPGGQRSAWRSGRLPWGYRWTPRVREASMRVQVNPGGQGGLHEGTGACHPKVP